MALFILFENFTAITKPFNTLFLTRSAPQNFNQIKLVYINHFSGLLFMGENWKFVSMIK